MSPGDLSEALLHFYNCQKYTTGARLWQDIVGEDAAVVPRSHDGLSGPNHEQRHELR